ncbi:TPA: hypothetical protein DIV55_01670 [Patescibacteria group bacterium]|uniref:Uncharacterized protein n=1 Tax=Candidatus Gottesmanbacteria bacterium GW2011_GWA1_43_11 TaxID=1618436 RepID=A0A0G1CFJ8_9BACT|nr:MAG: hypothetical protein UV59_C0022G0007 [Candidatus Gottesmanbacteria bacterium GW2011_GWA1_43_11]HCS78430.1 hypothetical protein [Patescibacteria group bacterium]
MLAQNNRRRINGFTMLETIVALGVLSMFFGAITVILQTVLTNIGESRVRTTALSLAQTKMELIRNLPYASVGTSGGIPTGPIPQNEVVAVNGLDFTVTTSIIYIDDEFDGVAPADVTNADYKRARVEITWNGLYPSRVPITLVTNIAPKGIETVVGGGTLFIQVFDANGLPVSNATVKIDNAQVTPQIHTQTLTNANGLVILPGYPACVTCYRIEASKSGFSSSRTYATSELANPLQPDLTVLEGEVSQLSFAIDRVSSLVVNSVGSGPTYPPVSFVLFTLRGTKIIGYDALDEPVYKYTFSTNTGGGTVSIPALEWDSYMLDFSSSYHNLAGSNPIIPLALTAGTAVTVNVVAEPKTNRSLLLLVKNAAAELQASAAARLVNSGVSYDTTKYTAATGSADFGHVYFGGLTPGDYELTLTLSGYQDATASYSINSNRQETTIMNLSE